MIGRIIFEPWPWWVGGPLIGVFVLVFILLERKQLGISSSLQFICAKVSPFKLEYFKDVTKVSWQFYFVIGLVLGGLIISGIVPEYQIVISEETAAQLKELGVSAQKGYVPNEIYNYSIASLSILLLGGILLGFGARYAGGCTSGHAIMGCAQLAPSSFVATVFFFLGGLLATYLIIPYILSL